MRTKDMTLEPEKHIVEENKIIFFLGGESQKLVGWAAEIAQQ